MAIQLRQGAYADFAPTKMVPAEVGIVTSGDPNTDDGKAAYVAFSSGNVKRIATVDDIATDLQEATDDAVEQATARAEAAAESVESSATQIATNTADINDLKADLNDLEEEVAAIEPGLSDAAKTALLNCFQHVAWIDEHGQDYYDALESALYAGTYPRITVTFNPGANVVYTDTALNDLKQYMTVIYLETAESAGTVISASDYTVSGVLTEGTSTVTVAYNGVWTSVSIPGVVDFYNIWHWSLDDGDFTKIVASTDRASDSLTGIYISLGETRPSVQYRRTQVVTRGVLPMTDYISHELTEYYPIPIPGTANKIRISITPNTQFTFINIVKYNGDTNKYEYYSGASGVSGWTQGTNEKTFTASENLFLSFNAKYDSAGTSYPTEPSNITVEFEEV